MVRPREFDEDAVIDAIMRTFWTHGYTNTKIEHLVEATGLNRSSLYGTFGRKPQLYRRALERYAQLQTQRVVLHHGPRAALEQWFDGAIERGEQPQGCLVINSLGEYPDLDPELQALIDTHLQGVRTFFATMVELLVPRERAAEPTDVLFGANVAIYTLSRVGAPPAQLRSIAKAALDRLPVAP